MPAQPPCKPSMSLIGRHKPLAVVEGSGANLTLTAEASSTLTAVDLHLALPAPSPVQTSVICHPVVMKLAAPSLIPVAPPVQRITPHRCQMPGLPCRKTQAAWCLSAYQFFHTHDRDRCTGTRCLISTASKRSAYSPSSTVALSTVSA